MLLRMLSHEAKHTSMRMRIRNNYNTYLPFVKRKVLPVTTEMADAT